MDQDKRSVDLLVVGSGGGGLVAALTAAAVGKKTLIVEKLPTFGGSTAISGGAFWIPNNSLLKEAGESDSSNAAWQYVDGLVGDIGPATSAARKQAYLSQGPRMVDFLREEGLQLHHVPGYADYYAARPGGRAGGRSIEATVFNGKKLGTDYQRMNKRTLMPLLALTTQDLAGVSNGVRTLSSLTTNLHIAARTLSGLLTGRPLLTMGMALVGRLMYALQRHRVELLTDTPLLRLLTDSSGKVTGAVVRHRGSDLQIEATHGVVLACGGFAHNAQMRAHYQPFVTGQWTHASRGDEGDGIRAGVAVGATVAQMDEAWWMPTSIMPDGTRHMCAFERSKPYSIIVDQAGERLCNECGSYMEVGQRMLTRQAERGTAIPCWFILDSRHRRFYPFAAWPAGYTPRNAFDSGYMIRAGTMDELARRRGIDKDGLKRTVERFNQMCVTGKDDDFHRGEDPYDCFYGDERVKPNPNLGPIEQAPFYAIALYPGDIGTNGGLLTDQFACVLREDMAPIDGLYATGNCTASVMGRTYPGAGATIGPSMVFGYIVAKHAIGNASG